MADNDPISLPPGVPSERRAHPRRLLSLEAQCLRLQPGLLGDPWAHRTLNLGTRGAGLTSHLPLERGMMLMLTLYLPPAARRVALGPGETCPAVACQPAALLSKVIWSRAWEGQYRYGVLFLDLEREQRARFKNFLLDLELDRRGSPWYL